MAIKPQVLANISDETLRALSSKKVLLAGETVAASLDPWVPEGFVQQAPREAVAGILAQFEKNAPKVHLSVDGRLFDVTRIRFAIALEGYIAWGLKERRKGATILFGGAGTAHTTNVSILVFTNGRVTEIDEKVLPEASSTYFRDVMSPMVQELAIKYPAARMVQAAPLENWNIPGVEYVGDEALKGLSYRPLVRVFNRRAAYVVPGGVAAIGVLFYLAVTTVAWNNYSREVDEYDATMADPTITTQGGIDTHFLDAMTARRQYMDQPRRQSALAEKAAGIVRGVGALPDVQILELKLPAPSVNPSSQIGITVNPEQRPQTQQITADRTPDVWISVALPKTADPAINQAKAAMTVMANNTGMSLRLAHSGWREDKGRRIFDVEGFIHE